MDKTANARFVNGVFATLEPVDFLEGTLVVLSIEATTIQGPEAAKPANKIIPNHSALLPGMDDPKKIKQLLKDEEVEGYLNRQKRDASA